MRALLDHLHRHAVGYVALFVAIGGTGYAATSLPRGSVGARQIKNHSITPSKFSQRFITGNVRAWAVVGSDGHVFAGGGKPQVQASSAIPGSYLVTWGVNIKTDCAADATINFGHSPTTESIPIPGNPSVPFTAGYAVAENFHGGHGRFNNGTTIDTFNQRGAVTPLGFDLAITC
jgi:hypothetical protein